MVSAFLIFGCILSDKHSGAILLKIILLAMPPQGPTTYCHLKGRCKTNLHIFFSYGSTTGASHSDGELEIHRGGGTR